MTFSEKNIFQKCHGLIVCKGLYCILLIALLKIKREGVKNMEYAKPMLVAENMSDTDLSTREIMWCLFSC